MRKRVQLAGAAIALGVLLLPTTATAQSAIAGVVRDTSGGVLPGVTVEASSDVLIEKVRSVVSDGQGQYKIVDLRPGTYVVTFTLPGFQTFRRENVQLPANFTSTINAQMRVGAIEESVTVSAQSPIVDVQSAVHTSTLDRDALDNIPTGKTIQGLGQLVVGVNLNLPDTGGARGAQQTYMSTHGMSSANTTVMVDGMEVNGLQADGAVQMYINTEMSQEVSYQTSGISAEHSSGGVQLNMIPREGGNTFSGSFNGTYRPGQWQSDNVTQRLIDRGLKANSGNATDKIEEYTFGQGGPIKKDKLWFFTSGRYFRVNNFIANTFFDDGSQGVDDQLIKSLLLRLTWQATPKNKLSAYFDEVDKYRGHDMQSLYDPETAGIQWFSPAYHTDSAKWTSTLTSKLLLEAGFSNNSEDYTNSYENGIDQPYGSAAWYGNAAHYELDLGGSNTAGRRQTQQLPIRKNIQGSLSYVTGSHNIKGGVQYQWGQFNHTYHMNGDLYQYYRSSSTGVPFSVPSQVAVHNTPLALYGEKLNADLGFYAQDAWTLKRLTLNYGLRWEHLNSQVSAATSPAGRFIGARSFAAIKDIPNWSDWAPRFAAVYDVFGDARTAIKFSLNRYNAAATTGTTDNYTPLAITSKSLTWRDLNGDDIAQGQLGCTFGDPGCEIDFSSLPSNFGQRSLNEFGDYPRTWNLESGLELQHEIIPQLSVTVSWFHGNFHNLTTTINRTLQYTGANPADNPNYTPFTVYNPLTGEAITAYGLNANVASAPVDNLDTVDPNRQQIYNSYNFEFRLRPGAGAQIFGGLAVERQLDVNCTAPDDPNDLRFCNDKQNDIPYHQNLKLAGSYPLPYGVTVSAAFQSNESPNSTRTMLFTRASRYPSTCPAPCPAGERIAPTGVMGQSSLNIPLEPAAATRVERINQLDLKFAKTFKVQRFSVAPTLEIFNVNNSDAIVSYVSTSSLSSSGYLKPNSILQGRLIGVGAQVRW
jgi:Carboxypeptidase regulatory-like domain